MTENSSSGLSAGELRQALEEAGGPWALDPDLDEDAPPPTFPLGGEVPVDALHGDEVEPVDFRASLSENPPADPELAQVCIDVGLLDPDVARSVGRRRPDQERAPGQEFSSGTEAQPDDVATPVFGERHGRVEPG
jgi:hypothetical protein